MKINITKRHKITLTAVTLLAVAIVGAWLWTRPAPPSVEASWWNDNWSYRKAIVINSSQVTADLENFPVLVSFTDENLGNHAQDDGDDFVFIDGTNGRQLSHEIEKYTSSTGELVAWVKIPQLSSTQDTTLYLYYGNSKIGNQQSAINVWDENYVGVWHLKEGGSGDIGLYEDSTSNANHGDDIVSSGSTDPFIDGNQGFDGTSDFIDVINNSTLENLINFTLSAWVSHTDNQTDAIIAKGGESTNKEYRMRIISGSPGVVNCHLSSNGTNELGGSSSATVPTDGTWTHVVCTWDRNNIRIYINGNSDGNNPHAASGVMNDADIDLAIGSYSNGDGGGGDFKGFIDEARVSNTARSGDWIKTSYNNQKSVGSFTSVQAEEVGPGPVGYWTFDEGYGTTAYDESGQGNDGTITGASWQDESMCVSGKCLYFDGSSNYVRANLEINPSTSNYTYSAWIRASSFEFGDTGYSNIVGNEDAGGSTLRVGSGIPNINLDQTGGGSWAEAASSDSIATNTWHYLAGTFDGDLKIYVDGVLKDTVTGLTAENDSALYIDIGKRAGGSDRYFHGFIDEVKIYPYARTTAEIWADYAAGKAGIKSSAGVSASFGSASDSWMTDGLVGYWKMDESATTSGAFDSSGNSNMGTYYGEASTTAGKFGNGGVFKEGGDCISISDPNLTDQFPGKNGQNTRGFTVSAWVKPDIAQYQMIASKDDDTARSWNFAITGNGNLSFQPYKDDSTGSNIEGDTDLGTGLWQFVTVVYAFITDGGSNVSLYVNGSLDKFVSDAVGPIQGDNAIFYIARRQWYGGQEKFFNGQIDEVRIYNRALSAREVRKLYQWAPGPVAWWKFDEGAGDTAYDSAASTTFSGGNQGVLGSGTNQPNRIRGKLGYALEFDGNDSVTVSDSDSLDAGLISVSVWVFKQAIDSDYGMIVARQEGTDNSDHWILFYNNDAGDTYYFCAVSCAIGSDSTGDLNQWVHLTGVEDGTYTKLYKNGVLQAKSSAHSRSLTPETSNICIGAAANDATRNCNSEYMEAAVDEVKIHNYALTQKQVLDVMAGGDPNLAGQSRAHTIPRLYLPFEDGYGSTVHGRSIYNEVATLYPKAGGTNTSVSAMWDLDGKWGHALEFDGEDDYAEVGTNGDFNKGTTADLTVAAWVKLHGVQPDSYSGTTYGYIVGKGCLANTNPGFALIVRNEKGNIQIRDNSENVEYINSDINYNDGEWHFIVGTLDRTTQTLKLYTDNVLDGSTTTSAVGSLSNSDQKLQLGEKYDSDQGEGSRNFHLYGLIDEVKIWNYALTPEEIELEYNQGMSAVLGAVSTPTTATSANAASRKYCVPGSTDYCGAPVLELDFNEKGGTTTYDKSGNGNDGVFVSSASSPTWKSAGHCKYGACLEFDGSEDYVKLNNEIIDNNAAFTLGVWFKSNSDATQYFYAEDDGSNYLQVELNENSVGEVGMEINPDTGSYVTLAYDGDYNDNRWHYLSIAQSAKNSRELFVDGKSVATDTTSYTTLTMTTANIGYEELAGGQGYTNGLIDHVRVYPYARTPSQIAWDFNEGKPIAEWRFDECSGSIIHDRAKVWNGGTTNDGQLYLGTQTITATGTCASSSASFWYNGRNGKYCSAGSFDGDDDYVQINSPNGMPDNNEEQTISLWYKVSVNPGSADDMITIENQSNSAITIGIDGGENRLETWKWGGAELTVMAVPVANVWHHVVYTFDNTTHRFFLDGLLVDASNVSAQTGTPNLITIGNWSGLSEPFDGLIDEVKIWNYALTPNQIQTEYNGGAVRFGQ